MRTEFISPMTSNFVLSSCTIWTADFLGDMFNFKQIGYHIMFKEGPESTKQLCTFLLNISKVNRKGGVCELDLSPIKIVSEE